MSEINENENNKTEETIELKVKVKKTKKDYNRKYYDNNREKIIKKACEKKQCNLCGKFIAHKTVVKHQTTNLCKKICLKNKYEKWLKDENENENENENEINI